ncbi:MAG: carbonate dehydratase [Lewinellaceae bacterium]|nr:carbonate dehydratase [Saprospiraceae bacterium]MCB9338394.1 carbonate dehydratase [Lewinellaceae bacterium]
MKAYEQLLLENKAWSKEMRDEDPNYFKRLTDIQQPEFLWIGCSDSRVPPNQITQTQPGEIFIHRNVANLVIHTDLNLLSVLQYAVEVLKVKHIVVCGHYNCGGVKAAMTNNSYGIINKWLRHIKDTYRLYQAEIDALPEEDRANRLIEINVREQVYNLAKTSIIQRSWLNKNMPDLHGWVYDLSDGIIKPLLELNPGSKLDHHIYEYANLNDVIE